MAQSADDMPRRSMPTAIGCATRAYGEVWVPDGVPRDWQPYEYGHWVYTDDWGWYWVSDDERRRLGLGGLSLRPLGS